MFKFISIVTVLIPVFLFLRTLFRQSPAAAKAVSEFRRQVDYLVWVIFFTIAVAVIYSAVNLIYPGWR